MQRRQWQSTPILLPGKSHGQRSLVGFSPWGRLSDFTITFHFHALEKEMATHSSVLAWRIPGTVEPGRLPSMGSHRIRHDWYDLAAVAAAADLYELIDYRKNSPFLPFVCFSLIEFLQNIFLSQVLVLASRKPISKLTDYTHTHSCFNSSSQWKALWQDTRR